MKKALKSVAFLTLFLVFISPSLAQEVSEGASVIPTKNETFPIETPVTSSEPVAHIPTENPIEDVIKLTPTPNSEVTINIPKEPTLSVTENIIPTPEPIAVPEIIPPKPEPTPKKPVVKLPKPVIKDPYSILGQENYRYPSRPRRKNLDLEVDGFYEIKYSGRDYSPKDPDDPRFERIVRDPIYNKIPRDVLLGPSKMDIRYQIQIDGKLDDDLSVHYDIEQEPDFPGKYEVQVKYKDKELTFFHYDAFFENGEYIQVKKALNGAQYYQETPYSELSIATGRQRSEPKKFATFGNGQKEYRLGNTSILRGSVTVWVNNNRRKENSDYKINYFDGTIEFTESPQKSDYIEIVYEFTNPIEDFLPVLSRKNFFGAQMKWRSKDKVSEVKLQERSSQTLWSKQMAVKDTPNETPEVATDNAILEALSELMNDVYTDNISNAPKEDVKPKDTTENLRAAPMVFELEKTPVVLGSDVVFVNDRELIRNMEYFIEHTSGEVRLREPILASDKLRVEYDYFLTDSYKEDIIGDGTPGPYPLASTHVLVGSVKVNLEDNELLETRDFIVDYDNGRLFFNYKIKYPNIMTVEYQSIESKTVTLNAEKRPLNVGVTYLNEYAKSEEEKLTLSVTCPCSGASREPPPQPAGDADGDPPSGAGSQFVFCNGISNMFF